MIINFDEFLLTKNESELFEPFLSQDNVVLPRDAYIALSKKDLITSLYGDHDGFYPPYPPKAVCYISSRGTLYREWVLRKKAEAKTLALEKQRAKQSSTIRYWVTTAIALLGIMVAIYFGLASQQTSVPEPDASPTISANS